MAKPTVSKTKKKLSPSSQATIRALKKRIKDLEERHENHVRLLRHFMPVKEVYFTPQQLKEMEEFRPTFSEFVRDFVAQVKAEEQNGSRS